MKTLEEKAKILLTALAEHRCKHPVEHDRYQLVEIIKMLKEQDRDTRHACAEAVISLDGYMDGPPFGCSKMVLADEAHAACMNVQAL